MTTTITRDGCPTEPWKPDYEWWLSRPARGLLRFAAELGYNIEAQVFPVGGENEWMAVDIWRGGAKTDRGSTLFELTFSRGATPGNTTGYQFTGASLAGDHQPLARYNSLKALGIALEDFARGLS